MAFTSITVALLPVEENLQAATHGPAHDGQRNAPRWFIAIPAPVAGLEPKSRVPELPGPVKPPCGSDVEGSNWRSGLCSCRSSSCRVNVQAKERRRLS
jgi:hypothetical protein